MRKKPTQAVPSAIVRARNSAGSRDPKSLKMSPEQIRGLKRQLQVAVATIAQVRGETCTTCRQPLTDDDEKRGDCESCKYKKAESLKAKTGLTSLPPSSSNVPAYVRAAIEAAPPVFEPLPLVRCDAKVQVVPHEPALQGPVQGDDRPEHLEHKQPPLPRQSPPAVYRVKPGQVKEVTNPLGFHYKPYQAELRVYYIDVPGWMSVSKKAVRADHRVVDAIAAQIVGKPRVGKDGKMTMALARNISFRLHKNIQGISGEFLAESVSVAATVAFTRSTEHEIEVANHLTWHNATIGQRHYVAQAGFLETGADKIKRFVGNNLPTILPIAIGSSTLLAHHVCASLFGNSFVRTHMPRVSRLRYLPLVCGAVVSALTYGITRVVRYWSRPDTTAEQKAVVDTVSEEYNLGCRTTQLNTGVYHGQLALVKKEYDPIPLADREKTGWKTGDDDTHAPPTLIQHLGLAFAESLPVVPASSSNNETVAIHDRLYNHDHSKLDDQAVGRFGTFLTNMLDTEFPDMRGDILNMYAAKRGLPGDPADAVYQEWNSTLRVSPSVASAHDEAAVENQRSRSNAKEVSLFIKQEPAFFLSTAGPTKTSAPRPIQNCSQQSHVILGPRFYCFSKMVADVWGPDHWCCYASGIDKAAAAAFLRPGVQYVGDVSRFDRGLVEGVLRPLHEWRGKQKLFSRTAQAAALEQLSTTWRSMRGHHSGTYKGQRRSGDDNTSIDNTILNIAAHAWAISEHFAIPLSQVARDYKIIALGDDIVISGPDELSEVDFFAILAKIGWVIKPAMVDNLDDVEFCSMAPWPSTFGRIFGAKPGRFCSRFGYCWDSQAKISMSEKAYGMLLNNNHVPFVRKILQRQLQLSPVKSLETITLPEWAMKNPTFMAEPTAETWAMFERLYGLGPADEQTFADRLQEWHGGPAVMSDPMIRIILEKEELAL